MAKTASKTAGTKAKRTRVAALDRPSGAASADAVLGGKTGTIDCAVRIAAGRTLRKSVPREAHGDWQPAPDRADPVAVPGAKGESGGLELLPIRYGSMAESQLGFFCG